MKIIKSEEFCDWLRGYRKAFENYSKTKTKIRIAEQLKYIERRIKDFEIEIGEINVS